MAHFCSGKNCLECYHQALSSRTTRSNVLLLASPHEDLLKIREHEMRAVKSNIKEYYYEELEKLSHGERELWLASQCTSFEQEVRQFFNEKEIFIEELHKKLKKVTRRWASWNHRNFGVVCSREQVRDLMTWERQNQPKFISGQSTSTDNFDNDPLEKFEDYCRTSSHLLHTFRQDIYRPLCDFFSDDEADSVIKEIPKTLEKCVQRWESLVQFSPVNEKLFNKQSEKTISLALKTRQSDIDTVLRLVPDLYEKKLEALNLARKWRLIVKSKDIQRRGTYTLSPTTLEKREAMPRCRVFAISHDINPTNSKPYDELAEELMNVQSKYWQANNELLQSKKQCEKFVSELESTKRESEKLKDDLKQTAEFKKTIMSQVNESQVSSIHSGAGYGVDDMSLRDVDDMSSREKIYQKELETVKARYSQQKIKFLNARRQIDCLNKQLEHSTTRNQQLEQNVNNTSVKCRSLEQQLETARKNIQTQGNMVEALQHQCYTLKQELDQSNIKKGDLYGQLSTTLERSKTVESELNTSRRKCKEYEVENGRRKSNEEMLERENTQLKRFIEKHATNDKRRMSREEVLSRENVKLRQFLDSQDRRKSNEMDYRSSPQLLKLRSSLQQNTLRSSNTKDSILPDINSGRSF